MALANWPEADGGRIAVARDAEVQQVAVGEVAPVSTEGMRRARC